MDIPLVWLVCWIIMIMHCSFMFKYGFDIRTLLVQRRLRSFVRMVADTKGRAKRNCGVSTVKSLLLAPNTATILS
jgi:hypothetical protein